MSRQPAAQHTEPAAWRRPESAQHAQPNVVVPTVDWSKQSHLPKRDLTPPEPQATAPKANLQLFWWCEIIIFSKRPRKIPARIKICNVS